jgi:hypothetical protein
VVWQKWEYQELAKAMILHHRRNKEILIPLAAFYLIYFKEAIYYVV